MNTMIRSVIGGLVSAILSVVVHAADLPAGAYSIGVAKGDVTYKLAGSDTYLPAPAGTALPQGATIKTGPASIATIVFSSGSISTVRPNSEVEVTKFQQAPFTGTVSGGQEPSVSNTQINLLDGEIVTTVAKLQKGSEFVVNSPVGAAGVRGTVFSVSFNRATGTGRVSVLEGVVVFTRNGQQTTANVTVTVTADNKVVVSLSDPDGSTAPVSITAAEKAELIAEVQAQVVVTPSGNVQTRSENNNANNGAGVTVPDVSVIGVSVN